MEELKLSKRDIYFLINTGKQPLWLVGADLRSADLRGADLRGANLSDANLEGADMSGADLYATQYNSGTKWPEGFDPEAAGAILVDE